jgi:nicotinamidase-related amidase
MIKLHKPHNTPYFSKACLLVIDDQETFFRNKNIQDRTAVYRENLSKFIAITEDYMPVIHVAMYGLGEHSAVDKMPFLYSQDNLSINFPAIAYSNMCSLPLDFMHPFQPETDLYLPKETKSALNSTLASWLIKNNIENVFACGVALKDCVSSTVTGIADFRDQSNKVKRVTVISDLTDNPCFNDTIEEQHRSVNKFVYSKDVLTISADDFISGLHPEFDLDMPLMVNQAILKKKRSVMLIK